MKTQGISLVSTGQNSNHVSNSVKANHSTFDSFMSSRAEKVKAADRADASGVPETKPADKDFVKVSSKPADTGSPDNAAKMMKDNVSTELPKADDKTDMAEEFDVKAFSEEMTHLLAQMFGLTEEEVTDILEQSGLDVSSLLFLIQPDQSISLVNREALQQFIMDVHGVTDKSAFLMNDILSTELSELTTMVQELGAEIFGVEPEQLSSMEDSVMLSFAEQFAANVQEDAEKPAVIIGETVNPAQTADGNASENGADAQEGVQVVVENYQQASNSGSQMGSETGNPESGQAKTENSGMQAHHTETDNKPVAAELFTERLSQAFGEMADDAVPEPEAVMSRIVEQVVRQVRIRVLPQTTSMELQLNPESLGKVALHVSSTGGVATATMVVENQMAKEALESQMITLKQSFEEQGLKVEAVEVTVSEFGLQQEGRQSENGEESKAKKHKFNEDAGSDAVDDIAEDEGTQTAQEKRDVNSMIDYTA